MGKRIVLLFLIAATAALAAFPALMHDLGVRSGSSVAGMTGEEGGGAAPFDILPASPYAKVLSEKRFSAAVEGVPRVPFLASDVLWDNGEAACDEETAKVFIPCSLDYCKWMSELAESGSADIERAWQGIVSGLQPGKEGGEILIKKSSEMRDPSSVVRNGWECDAVFLRADEAGKRIASEFHIVLTGLPVMCLKKTDGREIKGKERHEGSVRLIGTVGGEASSDSGKAFRCSFHVRGNSSSLLEKKPYRISLLDDSGKLKEDASWLGMRKDDDWILNPLYTDQTRVREKTAYQLWEKLSAFSDNPVPSSHMGYIELFLDGEYLGLYGLMEPIDGKQEGLSRGDLLYKISRWNNEGFSYTDLYDEAEEGREKEIFAPGESTCVEICWPVRWDATSTWLPMQAFHEFTFRSHDPGILDEAALEVDLDSVASLSLFCAFAHARDNLWKNTFLIAKRNGNVNKDGKPSYTLLRTIWDLNFVFGDDFSGRKDFGFNRFTIGAASRYVVSDSTFDFDAFCAANPGMEERLAKKWKAWRDGGLSAEFVLGMLDENRRLLVESGAAERERRKWPILPDGSMNIRGSLDSDGVPAVPIEGAAGADESVEETGETNLTMSGASQEKLEEWIKTRFAFLDEFFEGG